MLEPGLVSAARRAGHQLTQNDCREDKDTWFEAFAAAAGASQRAILGADSIRYNESE